MASSAASIVSRSLALIGEGPVSALSPPDPTNRARICADLYFPFVETQLLSHPWRFTVKKAQLSRKVETPLNVWSYIYALPSDRLGEGLLAVYPSTEIGARPSKDYEIFHDGMYTDLETVVVDYQYRAPENLWPTTFVRFIEVAFAAEIAVAIREDQEARERLVRQAWGPPEDNGEGGLYGSAKKVSSFGHPSTGFDLGLFTDARDKTFI